MKGGSSRGREWAAARGWVDPERGSYLRVGDQEAEAVGRGPWGAVCSPEVLRDPGRSPAHLPEAHRGPIARGPPSAPPRGLLRAYYYLKPGI